ncbi:unnamed protein product [Thelazia callipaeda]|uniref:Uncharacterized protein n=1 Tax=Thelazia callipaeda TaxID=103827 RepID=A0A0N5CK96_THECL|nr:unnamed protein product [Thelazia callipaeda]
MIKNCRKIHYKKKNKEKEAGATAITLNTSNMGKQRNAVLSNNSALTVNKDGEILLRIHAKPNARTTRITGTDNYH